MAAALETVVKQLEDSGIIAPGKLENFVPPKAHPKDADELVRELIKQAALTRFQGQHVLAGKAKALFLGNYTVLDKIGAGGMGQVFKAEHRRMERIVAIKMLPPAMTKDAAALARFQREVKAASKLLHQNIVTAFDADEANGAHFLVMEYVDGSDLSALVKKNGPLSVPDAINYILQAARGLEFAHGEGIVHRDIKPSNLLLDHRGTVKVLDMGLARVSDPLADPSAAPAADLTHDGTIMGTVAYMAPEQAMDSRQADARADLYSLGCTLHYLLTGRPPYGGDTVLKHLTAHQQAAIPLLSKVRPDIPPGLDAVFSRIMAKRPTARYQSAKELIVALESLSKQPASARPVPVMAQAVATVPALSGRADLESGMLPVVEGRSRNARRATFKAPLVAAAMVLLVVTAGTSAWMIGRKKPDEIAQSKPAATTGTPPSPPKMPAAITVDPKPAAEPPKARGPHARPEELPPKAIPAKAEPPVTVATLSPLANKPAPAKVGPTKPTAPPIPPAKPPAAAVELAAAPEPSARASDAKLPVPSIEAQRESLKLLKEVYKDDYAQLKQPEAKAALAEKLLNESPQTKDDAAASYTILREARDLAVDAANPALAERAISMLVGAYGIDPLKELAAALDEMANKPHPAEANHAIAEAALARIEEAQAANDFETVKQLADVALAAGRKAKDPALSKRAIEVSKSVTAAKQQWDDWQDAQATLAEKPDDPASNLTAGNYLCFALGDWEQGLALLAKGPDGPLKELAVKSLERPEDPAVLAEIGDAWFEAAEKSKGKDKADMQAGAAYWYSQAQPGLTGLTKTKIEKRLADLGGKVAVATAASVGKLPETMELTLAPGVSMKFRLIPAGTFTMGRPGDPEMITHTVRISRPFYLGVTEVTRAQWLVVTAKNPVRNGADMDLPIGGVSWNDCQGFVQGLNKSPVARSVRFRLPTEAEWEYACRAGTTTDYCFGDNPKQLSEYAWFASNSGGKPHATAQSKPNGWGLYDMYGNYSEWCSDCYDADYYQRSSDVDPTGPGSGENRVLRGGCWSNTAPGCSSVHRYSRRPGTASSCFSLRLACEPKGLIHGAKTAPGRAGGAPKPPMGASPATGRRPIAFNQAEIERNVATWVLSLGGKVKITSPAAPEQNPLEITDATQLPAVPFLVYGIDLGDGKAVTAKDLKLIGDSANLVQVKIIRAPLGDEGVAQLARQRNLQRLEIPETGLTDAGLPAIGRLTRIQFLTISHNNITDAGLAQLRELTELRTVWLSNTPIAGEGLKHLRCLPMLRTLGVPETKLAESNLKELAPFLRSVTYLSISDTPAGTDAAMAAVRALPALTQLEAGSSSVSDKGLEVLATIPGLKRLYLKGSRVTDAGVQRFKAARPDCQVTR